MAYKQLLNKVGRSSMSIITHRILFVEIYKTLNKLSPSSIKNIYMVITIRMVRTIQAKFEHPFL